MPPPKPWWLWKAPGSAELSHFDPAFAVKEYLQNQVGQIQKEKRTRDWSDWCIDDLRARQLSVKEDCKARLIRTYPGLLTGPHGASLRQDAGWVPVYVVSGIVPRGELKTPYDTDLVVCTVLWHYHHPTSGEVVSSALSFFNNHIDEDASFSTFVIDGATTSRNGDAVGEKGKGFVLATQYLHERVEENDAHDALKVPGRKWKTGVSFRVGHQIGELSWRNTRTKSTHSEKQLMVVMDDLTPWTPEQFLTKLGLHEEDDQDDILALKKHESLTKLSEVKRQAAMKVLGAIYKRRFVQRLSDHIKTSPAEAYDPSHEICRVRPDEVAITVIGLPGDLLPTELFSGIYGIIAPETAWRVLPQTDTPIYFFKNPGPPLFYHRDQIIRSGPTLNRLSINYRGDLDLSADRTAVMKGTTLYHAYRERLSKAAHLAFEFLPDLAEEIALDILTESGVGGSSFSRILHPLDAKSGNAYKAAFTSAWRTLDPSIPAKKTLYPYPASSSRDPRLIEELGMVGRPVSEHVMVKILQASGAFIRIHQYAESLLLRAPLHHKPVAGFTRLQRAIASAFPLVGVEDVIMVDYTYSSPKILWDKYTKRFVMGVPGKCSKHIEGGCLCWIGPYLFRAMDSWKDKQRSKKEGPSLMALCRVFLQCMEGTIDVPRSDSASLSDDTVRNKRVGLQGNTIDLGNSTPHEGRPLSFESQTTAYTERRASSRSHSPDLPLDANSHTSLSSGGKNITGIFNGVLDLCQIGLREAATVDTEHASLKMDTANKSTAINSLEHQAALRHDDIQFLREQLEQKEAELNYTRGLLTQKWAIDGDKRTWDI